MLKQILSTIACVIALNSLAQNTKLEKSIDDLSARLVNAKEVSGVNVLLLKDSEVIYNKAFGYADVSTKQPLKTDNIFRIASQTKAITSIAVMMLYEKGKILLDDPISKYIPQFKNPQVLDKFNPADSSYTTVPAQREVTIRDLLRHTSGIDYPLISDDTRMQAIYAKVGAVTGIGSKGTLKEKMELLAKQPLRHHPNTAFTYGLNTDVLGYLVEVVSGVPLDKFFQTYIFEPLQMTDTQFKIPQDKADRLVSVSEKTDKDFAKVNHTIYENSSPDYPLEDGIYLSGGAGLSSTTADYAKFLQMLLNKGTYNGKRILGAKTVELMTTNQLSNQVILKGDPDFRFGLGFELVTEENKFSKSPSIGTFSWSGAFSTHYWADPKENIIGLVFTQEYFRPNHNDLGTLYKNVVYANMDTSDFY
ncbi:serine hydrolase domain-containing protein [Epilithonimonas lactis]|uniref:Beta-lactamase-related domain-containing protein n=1 Tax=Epilithonimonas lactis TaxID=421072 RepID=A0A085B624_9FLAO|nr:serine hydrolase domain-containing protein [Epilithonimonas lactis]KFC17919.1 hypothetical protein IO89_19145 [Epilithonimonas lactis]SEP91854.1 CubicO group peptidase, beta-lactamase class C family [Epilithonimonas lactis]